MTATPRCLCVLTLLLLLGGAGCRRGAPAGATPVQNMEDFVLDQTLRGVRVWELVARTAVLHEEAGYAILSEPKMGFYQNGTLASRVKSFTGRVIVETHDVFLSSSVVVESIEDHSVMETTALAFSSKRNLFTTDEEVTVHRPEGILRGRGMEAKPDLSEIRIFHQHSDVKRGKA